MISFFIDSCPPVSLTPPDFCRTASAANGVTRRRCRRRRLVSAGRHLLAAARGRAAPPCARCSRRTISTGRTSRRAAPCQSLVATLLRLSRRLAAVDGVGVLRQPLRPGRRASRRPSARPRRASRSRRPADRAAPRASAARRRPSTAACTAMRCTLIEAMQVAAQASRQRDAGDHVEAEAVDEARAISTMASAGRLVIRPSFLTLKWPR